MQIGENYLTAAVTNVYQFGYSLPVLDAPL